VRLILLSAQLISHVCLRTIAPTTKFQNLCRPRAHVLRATVTRRCPTDCDRRTYLTRSLLIHSNYPQIRPLQRKVETLEEELRSSQALNQELERIRVQLANLETLQQRYDVLQAEVQELRTQQVSFTPLAAEFKQLKDTVSVLSSPAPPLPSTPKAKSPRLPPPG